MSDERVLLTPDQAVGLLADGEYVHNFVSGPSMMLGCDYERDAALRAIQEAEEIELAGPFCQHMNHAVAVWKGGKVSFFASDRERVDTFERQIERVP